MEQPSTPTFLIFDDSSFNSFVSFRLTSIGIFTVLISETVGPMRWCSANYGPTEYKPDIVAPTLDALSKEWDFKKKFNYVLIQSPTLPKLKSIAQEIQPFIDSTTFILINTNYSLLLEPVVSRILPSNTIVSIMSSAQIVRTAKSNYCLRHNQYSVSIGLSYDPSRLVKANSITKATLSLFQDDTSGPLRKLLDLFEKADISPTHKVSLKEVPSFSTQLWNKLIGLICYDCFTIVFEESNIEKLFYSPIYSPPIRHVMDELLDIARYCGNHQLPRTENDKMKMIKQLISNQQTESRNLMAIPDAAVFLTNMSSNLLYNYCTHQETNFSILLLQMILLSSEQKIRCPNIEFLYSVLHSKITKHTTNLERFATIKSNADMLIQTEKAPRDTKQEEEENDDDSNDYSSAACSIDSGIRNLYVGEGLLAHQEGSTAPIGSPTASKSASGNALSSTDKQQAQVEELDGLPKVSTQAIIVSNSFVEGSDEGTDMYLQDYYGSFLGTTPTFSGAHGKQIQIDKRTGTPNVSSYEESQVLINGPYYQDVISSSNTFALNNRWSANQSFMQRSSNHINFDTLPKGSSSLVLPQRRGYRQRLVRAVNEFSAHQKTSYELYQEHAKFYQTAKSSGLVDTDHRYGSVDSYTFSSANSDKKKK